MALFQGLRSEIVGYLTGKSAAKHDQAGYDTAINDLLKGIDLERAIREIIDVGQTVFGVVQLARLVRGGYRYLKSMRFDIRTPPSGGAVAVQPVVVIPAVGDISGIWTAGVAGVAGGLSFDDLTAQTSGDGVDGSGGTGPGKRSGDVPRTPARSPDRRHFGHRITTRSTAKHKNTLIDKSVDVDADVAAINAGHATRDAATGNWVVNGRTYGMHENGTVFPVSAPDFHNASRGGFKALGAYNEFGGATAAAKRWIAQRKLSGEAAAEGLRLYRSLRR